MENAGVIISTMDQIVLELAIDSTRRTARSSRGFSHST